MFASKNAFLGNGGGGYPVGNSVRLRSSATAYLNRTPSVVGNQQKWTWSGWIKRGVISNYANSRFFGAGASVSGTGFEVGFGADGTNNDILYIQQSVWNTSNALVWQGTAQYRDPSAWYHVVIALDTTQATGTNRLLVYVNGVAAAGSLTTTPTQNVNLIINTNGINHFVGSSAGFSAQYYFDGYLAEVNFIDGQQLTPSSFGSNNIITGVWQPIKYQGTYGTNGFYLKFAGNSTAAALGTDSSGNSNTWTVNNISVTAGVTYDSMTDVPTLTSATVANYAVLNPLAVGFSGITISNANLTYAGSASSGSLRGSLGVSSGLWYFEVDNLTWNSSQQSNFFGIAKDTVANSVDPGNSVDSYAIYFGGSAVSTLYKVNNSTNTSVTTTPTSGFTGMVAVNLNTNKVWFGANGTWFGSGDPAAGTNAAFTIANAGTYTSVSKPSGGSTSSTGSINFGQRPFSYTPPTGFVALNTYNLTTPTIPNGAAYMAATLYTGNNSTLAVTNTVNGTAMQPDLLWLKTRSGAGAHVLYDSVRGNTKFINSNTTAADTTQGASTGLTSFNSNGFTLAADILVGAGTTNSNGTTFVAWQWYTNGGATVSNTSGSITSTVSAGATQGFSVVTYTGTGANATVGHGLGVAPSMIIVKPRSTTGDWIVYTSTTGAGNFLLLDTTAASAASSTKWNNTAPTSSVFSVGIDTTTNTITTTYVAYVFAAVAGYSAFGSYTGNGSTDGPFVYLGFRPRFLLIKRTDAVANWRIHDSSRDTYDVTSKSLYPNLTNAETSAASEYWDFLSNGFKLRTSDAESNASAGTYIYMAFAENPFRYALAY